MKKTTKKEYRCIKAFVAFCLAILTSSYSTIEASTIQNSDILSTQSEIEEISTFDLSSIPEYSGSPYVDVNVGEPYFTDGDLTPISYERYSSLDSLGRCGPAVACIGQDIMPSTKRGSIGKIKPSGWHLVKYDGIDGKYLYNRCHLIAYELAGENANTKNLITGTRYLNIEGMLPFENKVTDYVKETNNHVLYRVTPIFEGENLVAKGVLMEAESVEDNGVDIKFCVFCYNVQPGISIDYATGNSSQMDETNESSTDYSQYTYVLNTRSKRVHYPTCSSVSQMKESNKQGSNESPDELIAEGYKPCGECTPFVIGESTTDSVSTSDVDNSNIVYVSRRNIIHSKPNCSGMKYYTEMTYDEAIALGYSLCEHCN